MINPDFSVSEYLFDCFLSRRKVYCYGATHEAALFIEKYPDFFDGVVDRSREAGTFWCGIECRNISEIDDQSIVVNCVVAAHAWSVDQELRGKTTFVLHIFQLLALMSDNHQFNVDGLSPVIKEWAKFPTVFLANINFYAAFANELTDETSAGVYRDYLDARLCGDILLMGINKSFCDPATMYFQEFLPTLDQYLFLDVGAFDGLNSLAFLQNSQNTRALCFDPNPDNIKQAEINLVEYKDRACIVEALIGAEKGTFDIEPNGSSTAKTDIASASSITVEQTTLDDVYRVHELENEKVFLKMDVEGSESDILLGASEFLKGENNVLALSCYHKSKDLETLWPIVKHFAEGKNVSFRHLTSGACETVLFIY